MNSSSELQSPQCQFFVVRKKRLCRMTVRPGRRYCGEHEPSPELKSGENDTRIPCPNDPKHTCYASKLEKHLSICNARVGDLPAYIVPRVNAPAPPAPAAPRRALSQVPTHVLHTLIDKINRIYEEHIEANISELPEQEIHAAVAEDHGAADRGEGSRRHLRQASSLLRAAEAEGLVRPNTCYVELGAGKGHLSYYAWRAWCAEAASGSRVLLVDRAALRHKRDNKLPRADPDSADTPSPGPGATRLRADLADLALARVAAARDCDHLVGFAKHLCGVATDYALRCMTAEEVRARTRGLVIATCCHHRCQPHALFGRENLEELGIADEDMDALLGVVSWGTCGSGRPRARPAPDQAPRDEQTEQDESAGMSLSVRTRTGMRAKAVLDWARVLRLRDLGLRARLVRYVPPRASPENVAIVARAC